MVPHVWLITGCSSGIGCQLAFYVLTRGDIAIATLRNPSKLPFSLANHQNKENLTVQQLDVMASESDISATVSKATAIYGRIGVLVNNAGYIQIGTIEELTEADWKAQFDTNVLGAVKVTSAVFRGMRVRREATVVFVGSLSGWVGHEACGAYAGSNFALAGIGIAESFHHDTSGLGIRTVLIEPGRFRTEFLSPANVKGQPQSEGSAYSEMLDEKKKGLAKEDQAQPGDPKKLVRVIVDIAKGEGVAHGRRAPIRIPIGPDCYADVKQRCEEIFGVLEEWEDVMTSTDF